MAHEQVDHGPGVAAVTIHPHGERLHAPQDEIAIERRRHGPGSVLQVAQLLGDAVVVDGDETSDDVAVPAEVLRRRVDDHIGPEGERLLEVGGGERVVDDNQRSAVVGEGGDCLDVDAAEQGVGR